MNNPPRMIHNPILPGFHPDPSWVWHDGWAYLTASTFAWLPGLPMYRSRDLVHWQVLPPALSRPGAFSLDGYDCDDGLYAPGLRHDGSRFLLSCTVVQRQQQRFRNFICTSADPLSGWSDPVWLPEDLGRIDPTPFVDDDGSLWLVLNDLPSSSANPGATREIRLWQLDAQTLQPLAGPWPLWQGAQLAAPTAEAPRIFRRGSWYYLLIAEGGTGHNHAVTMARSQAITGPYVSCPANPLLSHRHLGRDSGITCVGHADFLQWPDGSWWGCCLAERETDRRRFIGRETWIFPMDWPQPDDWPVLAPGSAQLQVQLPGPPTLTAPEAPPALLPATPDHGWLALRDWPSQLSPSLSADQLLLPARPQAVDDNTAAPALLARRIHSTQGSWAAQLTWQGNCAGGLILYFTAGKWLSWGREGDQLLLRDAQGTIHLHTPAPDQSKVLELALSWQDHRLQVRRGSADAAWLQPSLDLSPWAQPCFAGAVVGVWARGQSAAVQVRVLDSACSGTT